jgi:cytochrome c5
VGSFSANDIAQRRTFRCILILAGAIMMSASGPASVQFTPSPQSTQEAVFQQTCAVCHNNSATRAPARELAARDVARFHRRGADQRHHESARLEPFA